MSEQPEIATLQAGDQGRSAEGLASEIEKLPTDVRTVVSVMASVFRSSAGPDAETARIMAEAEMHEESCKLQAYTQSMKNRDQQNERDHLFRMRKLIFDNAKSVIVGLACVGGAICGLYLTVKLGNSAVGNPILIASFLALLGIKPNSSSKEKE